MYEFENMNGVLGNQNLQASSVAYVGKPKKSKKTPMTEAQFGRKMTNNANGIVPTTSKNFNQRSSDSYLIPNFAEEQHKTQMNHNMMRTAQAILVNQRNGMMILADSSNNSTAQMPQQHMYQQASQPQQLYQVNNDQILNKKSRQGKRKTKNISKQNVLTREQQMANLQSNGGQLSHSFKDRQRSEAPESLSYTPQRRAGQIESRQFEVMEQQPQPQQFSSSNLAETFKKKKLQEKKQFIEEMKLNYNRKLVKNVYNDPVQLEQQEVYMSGGKLQLERSRSSKISNRSKSSNISRKQSMRNDSVPNILDRSSKTMSQIRFTTQNVDSEHPGHQFRSKNYETSEGQQSKKSKMIKNVSKRVSTANLTNGGNGKSTEQFYLNSYLQPGQINSTQDRQTTQQRNLPIKAHTAIQFANMGSSQNKYYDKSQATFQNQSQGILIQKHQSSAGEKNARLRKAKHQTTETPHEKSQTLGAPGSLSLNKKHSIVVKQESLTKQQPHHTGSHKKGQKSFAESMASPEKETKVNVPLSLHAQILPKTAQSLPRRLQSTFMQNQTVMNLSLNNPQMNSNLDQIFKQKLANTFLPFTGVDQSYMLNRPQFTRQAAHVQEKINDVSTTVPTATKSTLFDKGKHKLIYDCAYGINQPMQDRDCRLYVPPLIRKQNGAHINEKVTKYYDRLNQFYTPTSPHDTTLVFESRFESGNLARATQVGETVYDLELRADFASYNPLMTQWFYFRIQNTRKNVEYTFNIINLFKADSSYNQGMKPLVYSEKHVKTTGNGWYRGGYDIRYFQTAQKIKKISGESTSYTLSFKIVFDYDSDTIYLSHCYPYTYSDLMQFLNRVCNPQTTKDRLKRTQMCRSIAGNSLDMLIITNLESSQDDIAERSAIVLSSRVHPGESNASFIIEGIIEFLMSDQPEAVLLREKYVFKIVPMLNPDGVIVGNYRCSLGGYDLNRQWLNPNMRVSPEIYCMKDMIKKTLECRKIDLFVDIHGHSRQKNLFIFGCSKLQGGPHTSGTLNPMNFGNQAAEKKFGKNGVLTSNGTVGTGISSAVLQNLTTKEKIFPWLLNKNCEDFSYYNCLFGVHKSKEATGRVVVCKEFNIQNSYTLEASFCGPTNGSFANCHFSIQSLLDMGTQFAKTLLEFSNPKIQKTAASQIENFYKNGLANFPNPLSSAERRSLIMSDKEYPKLSKRLNLGAENPAQQTDPKKQKVVLDPIRQANNPTSTSNLQPQKASFDEDYVELVRANTVNRNTSTNRGAQNNSIAQRGQSNNYRTRQGSPQNKKGAMKSFHAKVQSSVTQPDEQPQMYQHGIQVLGVQVVNNEAPNYTDLQKFKAASKYHNSSSKKLLNHQNEHNSHIVGMSKHHERPSKKLDTSSKKDRSGQMFTLENSKKVQDEYLIETVQEDLRMKQNMSRTHQQTNSRFGKSHTFEPNDTDMPLGSTGNQNGWNSPYIKSTHAHHNRRLPNNQIQMEADYEVQPDGVLVIQGKKSLISAEKNQNLSIKKEMLNSSNKKRLRSPKTHKNADSNLTNSIPKKLMKSPDMMRKMSKSPR